MFKLRMNFLLALLASFATSVLSTNSRHKSHSLRQFNGGQDAYYAPTNGRNLGSAYTGKDCETLSKGAIENADVLCIDSGCRVKCNRGYKMGSSRVLHLSCNTATGVLTYDDLPWQDALPPCAPKCRRGCPDGSKCIAPNECQEEEEPFFVFECNPPCQNGGTCIFEDVCNCNTGYSGLLCEEHRCTLPNLTPLHATFGGTNELTRMGIECEKGYVMMSGAISETFVCHHGQWLTQDESTAFDDVDVNCYG